MKKYWTILFILFWILPISAQTLDFTEIIQDLAVQTACLGQYSSTEAGGGWYDDPNDYYTPQLMAKRFANMSGERTKIDTFYGICFDYAQRAYEDIEWNEALYRSYGLFERQYWIAGVHNDNSKIELQYPVKKGAETVMQNGVPVKIPANGIRSIKTHDGARNHAWLWIERNDGTWFWIDPTWTDNLGYVVYGYIDNGKEIQCRPSRNYCINYPEELNSLPLPPKQSIRQAPSKTANSTNREETINDAGTNFLTEYFVDATYDYEDEYYGVMVSINSPIFSQNKKLISMNKIGFSLELPIITNSLAALTGFEYLQNLEDGNKLRGGLFELDLTRRLANNFSFFVGGGVGLRFDSQNKTDYYAPLETAPGPDYAWLLLKGNVGILINLFKLSSKLELSYDNVIGFSVGFGLGLE